MLDSNFLGTEGRTSTSCNHLANLAKEHYRKLERMIDSATFVTKKVTIVGQGESTISQGITDISIINNSLKEISQCKALIAYLREAIKEKDNLLAEAKKYISDEQKELAKNITRQEPHIDDSDIIDSWPLEKRVRYYSLEAHAAVYGKAIHQDGSVSKQRELLHKSLLGESNVTTLASNVAIYSNTPSIDTQVLEDSYFNLQKKYREYQASLNSLKTEIDDAVNAHNNQVDEEYNEAYKKWAAEYQSICNRDALERNKEVQRISKLKIIIPDNLKEIVAKIENL